VYPVEYRFSSVLQKRIETPNVVDEWLTFLLNIHIRVQISCTLTEGFHGFSQSLQANAGIVP
jgi:hypothetical protein